MAEDYRLLTVRFEKDGHGGVISALLPELPGVVSEGATEMQALDNLREAFAAAMETYRSESMEPPWRDYFFHEFRLDFYVGPKLKEQGDG